MWAQVINMLLGIWLMAAPSILDYNGAAADVEHITGPIVTTFAVVALSGCTRGVARFNIPCGGWLLLAPWVLSYDHSLSILNDTIAGIAIIAFAFIRRKTVQEYGGGWSQLAK